MATHAAPFEVSLEMAVESVYGTAETTLAAMTTTASPNVDLAPEGVEVPMMGRLTSAPQDEDYSVGRSRTAFSFETRPDDLRLSHLFSSMWQVDSGFPAGSPFTNVFTPYLVQPATFRGYTIVKMIAPSTADGALRLTGAIVKTIKLASSEGGPQTCSVEGMGTVGSSENLTAAASTIVGAKKFMHYDLVLVVGGTTFKPSALEMNFDNNLSGFWGNSQQIDSLVLGNVKINGSFKVSAKQAGLAEFTDLKNRVTNTFEATYGAAAAGQQTYEWDIVYQGGQTGEENGVEIATFSYGGVFLTTPITVTQRTAAAFS